MRSMQKVIPAFASALVALTLAGMPARVIAASCTEGDSGSCAFEFELASGRTGGTGRTGGGGDGGGGGNSGVANGGDGRGGGSEGTASSAQVTTIEPTNDGGSIEDVMGGAGGASEASGLAGASSGAAAGGGDGDGGAAVSGAGGDGGKGSTSGDSGRSGDSGDLCTQDTGSSAVCTPNTTP